MLQTKFYDTLRFNSEKEAELANEIYRAEYSATEAKITCPDGKIEIIKLHYEPRFGLDVSDHATIFNFIDADMEKRDRNK